MARSSRTICLSNLPRMQCPKRISTCVLSAKAFRRTHLTDRHIFPPKDWHLNCSDNLGTLSRSMNRAFLMAQIVVTLLATTAAISQREAKAAERGEALSTPSAAASTLLDQANLWRNGQPIPSGLLEYHKPAGGPSLIGG